MMLTALVLVAAMTAAEPPGKRVPDVLSILVGVNDDWKKVSLDDYERNLRFMVANSLAANPKWRRLFWRSGHQPRAWRTDRNRADEGTASVPTG